MKPAPCSSCPFRRDAQVALWEPAHYLLIAYLGSATDPVPSLLGASMGCHKYNEVIQPGFNGRPPMCAGWLLAAPDALYLRIVQRVHGIDTDASSEGVDILSPEEMLRVNGFDMERIPPRGWRLGDPRYPTFGHWSNEVAALAEQLRRDPDAAWEYVLPGSPLRRGVSPEQVQKALGAAAALRYAKKAAST